MASEAEVRKGEADSESGSEETFPREPAAGSGGNADGDSDSEEVAKEDLASPEEQDRLLKVAMEAREKGNAEYKNGKFNDAVVYYEEAITLTRRTAFDEQRSVFFCNRAACYQNLKQWDLVVRDCGHAIKRNPKYLKAFSRRAQANEALGKFSLAHEDFKKLNELDPNDRMAAAKLLELAPKVKEEQEKEKAEMLGKLKDLGNSLLGKFGLSLDNFQAVQDPNTGSYSINFKQNSGK